MKCWSHLVDFFFDDDKLAYFTGWIIKKLAPA